MPKRPQKRRVLPSSSIGELLEDGLVFHRANRLKEARSVYEQILSIDAKCVDALHLLSRIDFQEGRKQQAIAKLTKVVALSQDNVKALQDLGNMLQESGDLPKAEEIFRRIIEIAPDHADAHNCLGICLKNQNRVDEAIAAYRRAIEIHPENLGFQQNLGNALKRIQNWNEAEEVFRDLSNAAPNDPEVFRNLGIVLRHLNRLDDAKVAFERLLELDPDNPIARHFVAACDSEKTLVRADAEYVREVFDEFADTFESHLGQLGYDAPEWAGQVASQMFSDVQQSSLVALDAGCGTGLCGPHLKPLVDRLVGIDLSPKMIDKAKSTDAYDQLVATDLMEYLNGHQREFNLIVAADTFNYFGDLSLVFAACAEALLDGGGLVFTLEEDEDTSNEPYRLFPHGRFGHAASYVLEMLSQHGFSVHRNEQKTLRMEADRPVPGLFISARKN